jgi:hypothetical protein
MKKLLISILALMCSIMTLNAQIPNPGFESWTAGNPDGWATSNAPPAGLVNVTQTSDSHSGSYALKGEVVNFSGIIVEPAIQSGPGGIGFAISGQYHSFDLWYKFTPVGGDKFSVNIGLKKSGITIAQGAAAPSATVGVYTHLTGTFNYLTGDVPDSAIIQISITGPVTGNDYHVGSVMFVDDLSFSLTTGVENVSGSDLTGKSYPNPATKDVFIPMNENTSGEVTANIFDTYGNLVKKVAGQPQECGNNVFRISVESLPPGLYFYSINGQRNSYRGKFTVTRQS